MILLNHVTSNVTSRWVKSDRDADFFIAVAGEFGGATVTIKQAIEDEDVAVEIVQDADLVLTAPTSVIPIDFPQGTQLQAVVTNAGVGTDITVLLAR